jgi:hypothetical protein
MIMIGKGKSTLDTVVEAIAAAQGRRHIVGDQNPDKGYFYRSDQFNLAKRGVPAAYLESGVEVVGKPAGWGRGPAREIRRDRLPPALDELKPDWDFSGAVEDAQLLFYLGVKVAEGKNMPTWNPGDEFEGARKQALTESPRPPAAGGCDASGTFPLLRGRERHHRDPPEGRGSARAAGWCRCPGSRTGRGRLDDQPVGVALAVARRDDGPSQDRQRHLPAVRVPARVRATRGGRPETRRGCA